MTDALREQDAKRVAWEREHAIRLRGDDAAAARIRANFQPLVDGMRDMQASPEPDEEVVHTRQRWTYNEAPRKDRQ